MTHVHEISSSLSRSWKWKKHLDFKNLNFLFNNIFLFTKAGLKPKVYLALICRWTHWLNVLKLIFPMEYEEIQFYFSDGFLILMLMQYTIQISHILFMFISPQHWNKAVLLFIYIVFFAAAVVHIILLFFDQTCRRCETLKLFFIMLFLLPFYGYTY